MPRAELRAKIEMPESKAFVSLVETVQRMQHSEWGPIKVFDRTNLRLESVI